ncbi:alpha/beta fold hydrolase [Paenibacillus guangzhouensis]|uniref:alpha/beta fold hydrolase n=1 Tax=Paenibacillus guangzhouensis TaxID=1473112 RepID=UPI00126690FD|nr:alpha/beta hydrolase [Paenibacillus guangzhouensis]
MMASIFRSKVGKQKIMNAYSKIIAEWPVENKQHRISTSHGETFVIESGSPEYPALVLLHESLSNSFSWIGDVALLSERFHVFSIDLIGEAGFSDESRPPYKSGAYEQWLGEVLTRLGVEQCSIAGVSLGGWIALRYATLHPDKVNKLIVLCPGGLAMQRRDFLIRALLHKISARGNKSKEIGGVLGMDTRNPEEADNMRKALEFVLLITKYEKPRFATFPVFSGAELTRLTMPILVIFGDRDFLFNAEKSIDRIRQFASNVTSVLLPGVGHAILGQTARINDFLIRNDSKI